MKKFIGWLLVIGGAFLIGIDLALTEGGPAGVFSIVAIVLIFVGGALLGMFNGLIADDPNPEYSRLDRLDGRTPRPLSALTDEELVNLRREQLDAAYTALGALDYDRFDALVLDMDESRHEDARRLADLRAQAGWVWPKEEAS